MAKLPDATSLQRRGAPSETPGIRAPGIDYGPMAQGSKAIAEGIGQLGKGLSVMASANAEIDDYETKKKLLDFKLQTEMEFETAKREMPYGGTGYSDQWQKTWQKQAKAFVGKDDANIPASLRGKVGMALKQHEVVLMERAKREEWAEKDRATIEGLEQSLGTTRSAVEADPSRRDEMLAEGRKLIELSPITPAAKHRLDSHYSKELDKTAAITRLMKAQTAEDFDALKRDLAPEAPDKRAPVDSPSFIGKSGPASLRYNNPGAMYPGASSRKFGATHTEIIGGGHKIAVFPDAVSGAAAQFDLLNEKYAGKSVRDAIAMWSGGNSVDTYLSVIQRDTGVKPDQKLTREMLSDPAIAVPIAKAMAVQEAGRGYPLSDEQWSAAHRWANGGDKPASSGPVLTADASGGVPEQGYAGPFSRLTLSERKAMWGQAEAQRQKLVGQVADEIKALEGNAAAGYLMPQPMLDALGSKVEQMKDPGLTARYMATLGKASIVSQYQQRSPAENTAEIQKIREEFARRQPTPEERKMLTDLEDITAKQTNMIENDKLTWAFRSGTVPVKPLDFNSDEAMTSRLEHAAKATERFGGPVQYFTKQERDGMQAALKAGGDGLLNLSSRMVSKWGVEHTTRALAEISDKIPEAAVAGYLWANGVNTQAAQDIATTLKRRQDPNYKPAIPPRQKTEVEAQAVLGDVYRNFPPQQRDAILKAADAIYETRNKTPNEYNSEMYMTAVKEVIGERTKNGKQFGGIASNGKTMFGGIGDGKFLLPSTWRADMWRQTLENVTADDLKEAGLPLPADAYGKPVSVLQAMKGKLVQVGPGQYAVSFGNPDLPGDEKWLRAAKPDANPHQNKPAAERSMAPHELLREGFKAIGLVSGDLPTGEKPKATAWSDAASPLNDTGRFILDFNKIEPILRRRVPTSFW